MANPQCENGYFRIALELAKQFAKLNLSAYEWRFVWALWIKTWAWRKKADKVSLNQIVELTGICKSHVSRAKKMLLLRKIIIEELPNGVTGVTQRGNTLLKFNKNYDEWKKLPNGVRNYKLPNGVTGVTQRGNKMLPNGVPSKEKKDTNKRTPPIIPPKGDARNKIKKIRFDPDLRKFVNFSEDLIEIYQEKFPFIDIKIEIGKMEAYLLGNPQKRYKNYGRFITAWFIRAQDRVLQVDQTAKIQEIRRNQIYKEQKKRSAEMDKARKEIQRLYEYKKTLSADELDKIYAEAEKIAESSNDLLYKKTLSADELDKIYAEAEKIAESSNDLLYKETGKVSAAYIERLLKKKMAAEGKGVKDKNGDKS
ncbi:MAG: replication protein [Candidatus Helarchaeota archaeon]